MNLLLFWHSEITKEEVKGHNMYTVEIDPTDYRFTHIFEVLNLSGFVDQVVKVGIVNGNTGLGEVEWITYPRNDLLRQKLETGDVKYPVCLHVTSVSPEELQPQEKIQPGEEEIDAKQLLSTRGIGREQDDDSYLPYVLENRKTLICKRVGPSYGRREPQFDLDGFLAAKSEQDGEPPNKRSRSNSLASNTPQMSPVKYSGDKKLVHFIQRLRVKLKFTPEQLYQGHEMQLTRKTFFTRGELALGHTAPAPQPILSPSQIALGSPEMPLSPLMRQTQVKERKEGINYVFFKGAALPKLPDGVTEDNDPLRTRLFYVEDPILSGDLSGNDGPSNLVSSEASGDDGKQLPGLGKIYVNEKGEKIYPDVPENTKIQVQSKKGEETTRVVIPGTPELTAVPGGKKGKGASPHILKPPPAKLSKPVPKAEAMAASKRETSGSPEPNKERKSGRKSSMRLGKAPLWDVHPNIDVILCCPRPKTLDKIFAQLANFGVRRIFVVGAAKKVEPSYFSNTKKLSPENIERALLEGLSQSAYYTRMPMVRVLPKLSITELLKSGFGINSKISPKIEKNRGPELPPDPTDKSTQLTFANHEEAFSDVMTSAQMEETTMFAVRGKTCANNYQYGSLNLVAHPSSTSRKISDIICDDTYAAFRGGFLGKRAYNRIVLCIGPEGGWTDHELEHELTAFEQVSLGPRVLKTSDATQSVLTLLYEELGI